MNIQHLSAIAEPTSTQTAMLLASKNSIILAAGATILLMFCFFLLSKQKLIAFLSINVITSLVLFVVSFRSLMSNSSNDPLNFWLRYGIPLLVIFIFSILLFLICLFEKRARKAEYNRIINGLYKYLSEKDENIIRNSDFEEYLNTYDGFEIKGIINKSLKRSEKIRKRKRSIEEDK